jgi:aerobic-type carbon monoxide dehydrogenase small subunit (CoxS/CutS family)
MKRKTVSLKVNGVERSVEVEARTWLLDMVREQFGLTGAKLGCDMQVCGACTVLVDGKPVSACSVLAMDADGCAILTVEGVGAQDKLDRLQPRRCSMKIHSRPNNRSAITWREIFAAADAIRKSCRRSQR